MLSTNLASLKPRRHFLARWFLVAAIGTALTFITRATALDLSTATIADLNAAFDKGTLTSEKLIELSLARIKAYDQAGPKLNAIITLNPKALETARALDAERKAKGPRSPLHGIPVVLKDLFDTDDMPTTAGFKPMATSQPARDAFVVKKLRDAGAIILAKVNMSDWFGEVPLGTGSTLAGDTLSPYNPKIYAGGSSTGTGVALAAWFATTGLGSDTAGSIIHPAANNALFGLSATQGLISRTGMIQSSFTQERGGPLARTVYDIAATLDAIAGFDTEDLITMHGVGKIPDQPYTSFVRADGLKGARIGVLRDHFKSGPDHAESLALMETALADMKKAGATLVDPVSTGANLWEMIDNAGVHGWERKFAHDLYLKALPPSAPIRSVEEMLAKAGDLTKPVIAKTAAIQSLDNLPEYEAALKQQEALRTLMLELMDRYDLDALVFPCKTFRIPELGRKNFSYTGYAYISAYTGFPSIVAPGGFTASDGMPFSVQFMSRPWTEPTLLKIAAGYEAATHHYKPPALIPALPGEKF